MEWRRETLRGKGDDFCDEQAARVHSKTLLVIGLGIRVHKGIQFRGMM